MPNPKKTYKDIHGTTRVGDALRWLVKQGKDVAPELLEIASVVTGVEALEKLGDIINNDTGLTEAEKMMLKAKIEMDKQEVESLTIRWKADMISDSWLSKNIRPMTLAFLTVCLFLFVMLDSSIKGFHINTQWISLLETLLIAVYLAYFGSRGVEKFKKISKKY